MKILSTVKYKVALASTALFISASSFAAEGATGGTDYAGQAMDALLTQARHLLVFPEYRKDLLRVVLLPLILILNCIICLWLGVMRKKRALFAFLTSLH